MDDLKILVVDDESRMRKLVKDFLIKDGYIVIEAGDGQQALDIFYEDKDISLIILDVLMPNRDGWEVCREIRKNSKVPIIMLTAKSEERDELLGFELGVDEYISKPFSPKILAARVSAILRRANIVTTNEVMEEGGITINKVAHSVSVDGKDIELSYKEFELFLVPFVIKLADSEHGNDTYNCKKRLSFKEERGLMAKLNCSINTRRCHHYETEADKHENKDEQSIVVVALGLYGRLLTRSFSCCVFCIRYKFHLFLFYSGSLRARSLKILPRCS